MLFEKFAADYARFRPGYPPELVKSLIHSLKINNSSLILDLACGTGKLGNSLQSFANAAIIGVDRSLTLLTNNRTMPTVNGMAETLPLKAESFDAVIIGQAFHWFDFAKTLNEIRRILKPGCGFAIIWYRRRRPLQGHHLKMDELLRSINPAHKIVFMDYDWREIIKKHGGFFQIGRFETEHAREYSIPDYIKLQRSKSYIGDTLSEFKLDLFIETYYEILYDEYPDGIVKERLQYFYVNATKA